MRIDIPIVETEAAAITATDNTNTFISRNGSNAFFTISDDTMFSNKKTISIIVAILAIASTASASVFLGGSSELKSSSFATRRSSCRVTNFYRQRSIDTENQRYQIARSIRRHTSPNTNGAAMAIPGMWFAFFDVSTLRLLGRLGIRFGVGSRFASFVFAI